ncbi:MAG: PEGA domain-containing protein [Lentisphaeria bacterium]
MFFFSCLLLGGCGKSPRILIESNPSAAALWEEDELLGYTPLSLPLPENNARSLIIRQLGCQEVKLIVEATLKKQDQQILVKLSPLGDITFCLTCTSTPPGADFFLNGEFKGRTPLEISGLTAGEHEFILRHKDRQEVRKTLFLSNQSPETSSLHIELPSQLVAFYRQQIETEPKVLQHYADLGHQLILDGQLSAAIATFKTGLLISLSGQGAGEDHRLWSEVDRVITKQYDYGSDEVVLQANRELLNMLRELKKEFPVSDSIFLYMNYAACADQLNFRQEAQNIFDEAWSKWPENRLLKQMKKRFRF